MKIFLVVVFSLTVIALLFLNRSEPQARLRELPPARVITDTVKTMDIQPLHTVTGKLQPSRKAHLSFQVSGQIKQREIEPGQLVTAGSVLLHIDDGDFADARAEAGAALQQEQDAVNRDRRLLELLSAESEVQQREVTRMQKLGRESLASQSGYDQALQRLLKLQAEEANLRHSVDSATARMMIVRSRLNKAERNLKRTKLPAPFDGMVNAVFVEVGDYVTPGQIALELIQNAQLDLHLEISSNTAINLALGQLAEVGIDALSRQGRIVALSVDPDPRTNTHNLRVRLDGQGLYPGQLARAQLPGKNYHEVNVIPTSAILYEDGQAFVYSVPDEQLIKTPVTLIQRVEQLQIIEGIEPHSRIVVRDVASLANGQKVNVNGSPRSPDRYSQP